MNYKNEVQEACTTEYIQNEPRITITKNQIILQDMLLDLMSDELLYNHITNDEIIQRLTHPAHPELSYEYNKNMFTIHIQINPTRTTIMQLTQTIKDKYTHVAYEMLLYMEEQDINTEEED